MKCSLDPYKVRPREKCFCIAALRDLGAKGRIDKFVFSGPLFQLDIESPYWLLRELHIGTPESFWPVPSMQTGVTTDIENSFCSHQPQTLSGCEISSCVLLETISVAQPFPDPETLWGQGRATDH